MEEKNTGQVHQFDIENKDLLKAILPQPNCKTK